MRFLALLKGQQKEILIIGVVQILIVFGFGHSIISNAAHQEDSYANYAFTASPIKDVGSLLIFASILCGAILGLTQFWIPGTRRTWHFLLHRSASRTTILLSRITAALITLVVFTGGCWTLLFLYASQPKLFVLPPTFRVYIEGWLFVSLGLVSYLGVALSSINPTPATKLFGTVLAGIVIFMTFMQFGILWASAIIAAGIFILAIQLYSIFLNREF